MFDFSLFTGIILVLLLGSFAARHGLLSEAGILASILVGLTIYVFGGWNWFILLMMFFLLASLFGRYKRKEKAETEKEFEKGGARDFWQVGANGALAALIAVIYHFLPLNSLYFAFLGTIATVTADTLATEVGVLSKKAYRITNFKPAPRGTSGAVSLKGLTMTLIASLLIGIAAVLVNQYIPNIGNTAIQPHTIILITVIARFVGALVDSLLGATVQVMHYCKKCRRKQKKITQVRNKNSVQERNKNCKHDTVNLISSMIGAAVAFGLYNLVR